MADIELIIKVPEESYNFLKSGYFIDNGTRSGKTILQHFCRAIYKGKPLPKGHGRIGDLDKLIKTMKNRNEDNGGEPLNAVDRGYDLAYRHMTEEIKECVIIEADKESE